MDNTCRLSIIFASCASVAVIFRRGPTNWCQAIRWDTLTDRFESGQWLRGKVYPERCALSPDGELMVYFALKKGHIDKANGYCREFTAVSRPPYFTALALWPWGSTWGGGGYFDDEKTLVLASRFIPEPHPKHLPQKLRVLPHTGVLNRKSVPPKSMLHQTAQPSESIKGMDQQGRKIVIVSGVLFEIKPSGERNVLRDFNGEVPEPVECPPSRSCWP